MDWLRFKLLECERKGVDGGEEIDQGLGGLSLRLPWPSQLRPNGRHFIIGTTGSRRFTQCAGTAWT